ncbi:hypothetical protein LEP1GSC188_2794 [Leptospira weilii serovar Topaz str. LT2116]|uniref:Uncharacterized protein n=1 Tax=Leptospira weilii serovar Topaz str. LT2116 TaxID=1088540 RepID=M3H1Q3_9LEPT|nr:hypothetical protein LEP1GSC188_2794 [Leptospira weilii serovar Topaz str. LT2116]
MSRVVFENTNVIQILLLGHMKMVTKINGRFLQRYKSAHKIAPNLELLAFLKKI